MGRRALAFLGACVLLATPGCGGLKLLPVSGTVTLNGQPLTGGRIAFVPDEAKGNTARVACFGRIDSQGHYVLNTMAQQRSESGPGVPLGWYKVTLIDQESLPKGVRVNHIYFDEQKTPLAVEVAAEPPPGAYDFKLTGP